MNSPANRPALAEWAQQWLAPGNASATGDLAIEHSWNWPAWLVVLLVLACVAWVLFFYRRERHSRHRLWSAVLALLRVSAILVLIFMLYGYVLRPFRTDLPDVVVALDLSASMEQVDSYADARLAGELRRRLQATGQTELTRWAVAQALLREGGGDFLKQLSERYHVRYFAVGSATRSLELETKSAPEMLASLAPGDTASRLGQGVRDILESQRGRPTAAILLFSDGLATAGPSLAEAAVYARGRRVQLFTVGLGSSQPPRNVRLGELVAETMAFAGDAINFEFRLTGEGLAGQEVRIGLRHVGDATVLDETKVVVPAAGSLPVSLSHRPTGSGSMRYEIVAEPLAGETDPADNRLEHEVTVANPTLKVLLVQDYPSFEFRYLKTLLERQVKIGAPQEKAFAVTVVLQEADARWTDATARNVFPVSREELFQYHAIVFGDVNPAFLGGSAEGGSAALANVADFVRERGGGIAFVAGPRHTPGAYRETPLAELFPFQAATLLAPDPRTPLTTPFTLRPTPLGQLSPWFQLADEPEKSRETWSRLPGLYWCLQINDLKRGSRVLAEHPDRTNAQGQFLPVVMSQYVGAGKVVFHATDDTWRWRLRVGDVYFARYWTQLLRYLARSSAFDSPGMPRLTADRARYKPHETVGLRVEFPDDRQAPPDEGGVTVVAETEGGKLHRVTLQRDAASRGVFEATLADLGEGHYHAYLVSPTVAGQAPGCNFEILPPAGEREARAMNATELRAAAEATGGKFFDAASFEQLLASLPAGRQVRIEPLPPVSLWKAWPVALLFVVLLVGEWLLRKWVGLV